MRDFLKEREAARDLARAIVGVAVLALLGAFTACSSGAPSAVAPVSPLPATTSAATGVAGSAASATQAATPTQPTTPPADLAHLQVALVARWRGFAHPVYLTNAGDGSGRLFVVEQGGTVRVIRNDRPVSRPYLDIRSLVTFGGERGLLGMAFAPHFATNGHVYFDYVDVNGDTVIARYTAKNPASDAPGWDAPQIVLHISQPYPNHKGGCLQFGPDGYLWIGMGDGGSEGDPDHRGQNSGTLLAKMLRIDVEGPAAGATFALPPGQPAQPGWAPEIWMMGLRNPWRFSFDASTGLLWIADVGQDAWEELDVVNPATSGQNFGWSEWEGDHAYRPGAQRDSFVFPIYEYPHPFGGAITGGYVYRGTKYPALVGTYVFGDYVKGWIGGLRTKAPNGTALAKPEARMLLTGIGQPSSFGVDQSGELYAVDYGGTIYSVTATSK